MLVCALPIDLSKRLSSAPDCPIADAHRHPAVVPDQDQGRRAPAVVLDHRPRIEIVLGSDCRIIAEGSVDADILLKLACGLRLSR